ncbi:hypothetical protein [Fimbriimonas ginsengisoli]|uniref:Uncharacterized protein n=1 Tax=Fimbriimonas ginsengisoli Gsoil 348 TaxID=661478 RepID=A0A068NQ33_FIMGI|nr:hypothetical protein [Fimbriimonas ginsengisoli]AIE85658.1 hypothetical protein OP10G_2290 [Fimbriimonas ginsengisoli Gsoil 348]
MVLGLVFLLASRPGSQGGQYTAELKRLADADQADRQFASKPTAAQRKTMERNDAVRLRRVRQIVAGASELNADEFDMAALLFQHAPKPEDFVVAHELSACANALGKLSSMPAISEDRFLVNIHRKQRFGSQFERDGKTQAPVDEKPPTAVTDDFRLNMLCPPLALYREKGPMAFQSAMDPIFARLEKRRDPKHRLAGDPVASAKLASMPPSPGTRAAVLGFYQKAQIVTAADYGNAAKLLLSSSRSEELLLAHEFATLAMNEGYRPARRFFTDSWDAFMKSIGRHPRYSAHHESRAVRRVLFDPFLAD